MDSNHLRTVLETGRLPLTTSPCILLLSNPQCDNLSKESLEGNFRFADRNCFIGPEDRTRTDTMLPSAVFETAVYANSTTTGYEVGRETGAYAVVPVSQRVSSCFAALKPLEPMKRVELSSPAWKAGVLAVTPHRH